MISKTAKHEYDVAYYAKNKERILQRNRAYQKANKASIRAKCHQYYLDNKERLLQKQEDYYQNNREARNKYVAEYRKRNRERIAPVRRAEQALRRARLKSATLIPFTPTQLEAHIDSYARKCWMCGGPGTEIDHVIALSRGGSHSLDNIRPACSSCNRRKWANTFTPSSSNA